MQCNIQKIREIVLKIFLLTILTVNYSYANQARNLITKHIEASGGHNALLQMQSISRHGQINFYTNNKLTGSYYYQTDIVYPVKLREQIKGDQILYDRGTTGLSFWLWMNNRYEFTDNEELKNYMRDTAQRANREMIWIEKEANNFALMFLLPYWAPHHSQCIQQMKSTNNTRRVYCFDNFSGLLFAIGDNNEHRLVNNWKQVGNIKIPFNLIHYKQGSIVYEVQLDRVKLNDSIPDSQFIIPKIL